MLSCGLCACQRESLATYHEGNVANFDIVKGPLSKELDLRGVGSANKFLFSLDFFLRDFFDVSHGVAIQMQWG